MVSLNFIRNSVRVHLENVSSPVIDHVPYCITPNLLTWGNLIFTALSAVTLVTNFYLMSLIMLLLAFICDTYDGIIARARNEASRAGYFFDSSVDRLSEAIWYFGLFLSGIFPVEAIFLLVIASYLINYFRVQLIRIFGDNAPGFMEKGERNIYFLILVFALVINFDRNLLTVSLWIISVLSVITVFQLFSRGLKMTKAKNLRSSISDPLTAFDNPSNRYLGGT